MKNQRRKFSSKFKSKVVLEAITERESISDLAEKFDINRSQITEWKKKFLENAYLIFELDVNENSDEKENESKEIETDDQLSESEFMNKDE